MRLLKLRLKNLNSLLGSWEIDFTHPRYLSDRLFIITGPTGSGKTTILDAICLALYGQTPRLSKISQSANEIMSKSANDCFAEVEFQARDGFFRASFSQKRAKSSANPFAAAQHEIALAESGEILESSISTKIAKVEELVGMDFGRFTKSILLAQGHFAAFLEADAKDRGLILESITKTEIYGQISTRAYELAATEKTALDVLIKELESLEILDPQEKETLLNALEDLEKSDLALSQKLKTDRLALDWVRNLSQIQKDKDSLVSAKEALTKETQDFAPLAEKLALALKALELESQYVSLAALRLNQTKDQQSLSQTQEREIHSQAAIETAKINLRAAETTLAAKDAAKTEAQPKLSQARALDQQIRVVLASWTEKNQESQKLLARKGQLERTISQLTDSLQTLKKAKDQTTTALTENARDQTLSESLGALEKDANNLTETLNQASNAKKDLERTVFSLKSIGQNLLLSQKKLAEKQTELALLVKDQEATALTLTKISEPSLAYYRDQETQFLTLINNIKEAETFWRTYLDQTTLLSSLGQKKAALSSEMAQNAEISQALSQSAASLEESLELLEASFVAAEAAASLNEHRLRLTPNQPCPLCGALTHPYAQGTAPSPNTAKKDLTAAKAALKETQKRLDKLGQTLAAQNKEAEHLATDETKTLAERETAAKELAKRLTLLNVGPFDPHNPELGAVLANLHKATEKDRAATQSRLAKADEITLELDRLRKRADLAQTELTKAQNSEREIAFSQEKVAADRDRLDQELLTLQAQIQDKTALLGDKLRLYGYQEPFVNLNQIMLDLKKRKETYQKLTELQRAQEKDFLAKDQALAAEKASLELIKGDLSEVQKTLLAFDAESNQLTENRKAVLGVLDPDVEAKRLDQEIQAADKALKKATETFRQGETDLKLLLETSKNLSAAIAERGQRLVTEEDKFLASLSEKEFLKEEAYLAARLSQKERADLAKRQDELKAKETRLESLLKEKIALLAVEEAKNLTTLGEPELTASLATDEACLKAVRQDIGSGKEKLAQDEKTVKIAAKKTQEKNDQEKRYRRFDDLRELIGERSGKKFRNFVQALTFEKLVQNANVQLQKMSPRYLLRQHDKTSLSFVVLDNFQGGLVRPIQNLSGGENFLVSLALALGLSVMSSENVEVNSLFLDEGFGSLDEETLDLAITALADLPQVEGKTIGLISHVPGLERRIGAQIRVIPDFGGRSRLEGPGCQRLSS